MKEKLTGICQDKGLAALGDTYVNFMYSLAKTKAVGNPQGGKVRGKILTEAFKNSGLRHVLLPKRLSSHAVSDATESLLVYCWIHKIVSLNEAVSVLSSRINVENLTSREREGKDAVDAFTLLLVTIKDRLKIDDCETET